jgi:hypothetical protein
VLPQESPGVREAETVALCLSPACANYPQEAHRLCSNAVDGAHCFICFFEGEEAEVEEREFYDERQETKKATLKCPNCNESAEYDLGWFVRTKRRQLPPRADERDRAKFAKARSYMVRRDDLVACKNPRCRKRFEVSGVQSVAFLDEQVPTQRVQ